MCTFACHNAEWERTCVFVCVSIFFWRGSSVFLVIWEWMFVCEAVDSRQASLLSFSSLPQREAKRLLSIQELKKGGDKGPKLNKCWKAAWRASPWSCALNERERLWDNPSGSFSGETTQMHSIPGIQFNYKSTHTGVAIYWSPPSVWDVSVCLWPYM